MKTKYPELYKVAAIGTQTYEATNRTEFMVFQLVA
jgi:hypothetical protein